MKQNIYEVLLERSRFIFCELEDVYISFSGGKDGDLFLGLVLDFKREYCPDRQIGVFHQDFEAQCTVITQYTGRTFERIKRETELYWACLPMTARTALSSYRMYWYPQDDMKEEQQVHRMSDKEYIINSDHNPITTCRHRMHREDLARRSSRWYRKSHGDKKTVCLLEIRADEPLQGYNRFLNERYGYKDGYWISEQFKNVWCASPLHDWKVNSVQRVNYLFSYDYDKLYDLYYKAGPTMSQTRVASPFSDYSKDTLNLYRVTDTEVWCRLVGRVQGVNFAAIYGRTKAVRYRSIALPQRYTWKSYTQLLPDALPKGPRNNYIHKFNAPVHFWHETSGSLDEKTIREPEQNGYRIERNRVSNYTPNKKPRIVFLGPISDDTGNIKSIKDIPGWKRMCYCILGNDHIHRFMGFGLTRQQQERLDLIKKKHESVGGFNYGLSESHV